jgi:NTP pyrophosphatase (non-canonical NTP hydrolase)
VVKLTGHIYDIVVAMEARIDKAVERYGAIASTHEGLGVACEEWDELRDAIRANDLQAVERECIDLAAVLIRMAHMVRLSGYAHERSVK